MVQRGERGAVLRQYAVGGDGEDGEPERHRQLAHVGVELRVRGGDVGVQVAGLLELDDRDRQTVAVEDKVEAAFDLVRADGHLVDGEELILVRVLGDEPDGRVVLDAFVVDPGDAAVALGEEDMHAAVLGEGVARAGSDDLGSGLLEVLDRDCGVEPLQSIEQARR